MAPNMADKDGTLQGRETMWLGRIGRIGGSVAGLARHANGVVLFACGSGGTAGINVRYMRMLASLGFIVLSPDTMSYEPQLGLRHRRPKQEPDLSDYWSLNPLYQSGCSWPAKGGPSNAPFCYSSEAANITASPESWKRYYQRVYALRERELDFVVGAWEELVGQQEKVFLMGHSEGGMVVGRYSSPTLDRMLSGR